jgi:hypothetical protein
VGDALLFLRAAASEESSSSLPLTGYGGESFDRTAAAVPSPSYAVWKNGVLADVYDKVENGDVLVVDAASVSSRPAVLLPESCG